MQPGEVKEDPFQLPPSWTLPISITPHGIANGTDMGVLNLDTSTSVTLSTRHSCSVALTLCAVVLTQETLYELIELLSFVCAELESRCPRGTKTLLYHRAKLEKYAEYLNPDGLVTTLTVYSDSASMLLLLLVAPLWSLHIVYFL